MTELLLSLAIDALVAVQHAEIASFATGRAIEAVARHAAILPVAECDQAPAAKFLPCLQRLGRCQMRQ